jgi:TRAP-type C4-dicarboxylate transport system permease large subunit
MSSLPTHHRVTLAATVFVFAIQLWALIVGISPNINTRAVQIAEVMWPGYAGELRQDPVEPDCDLAELDKRLAQCPADTAPAPAAPAPDGSDPFGGNDPFGAAPAPAPAPAPAADPFAGADPFAAPAPAPAPAPAAAPASGADPFAGGDPFAAPAPAPASGADPFAGGDPFAAGGAAAEVNCPALRAFHAQCSTRHEAYTSAVERLTPTVKTFRAGELFISAFAKFPYWKELLALVVLLGGLATTVQRNHIAIREPRQRTEHIVSQTMQMLAHLSLFATNVADWQVQHGSHVEIENGALPVIWAIGFLVLAGVNAVHLMRPPPMHSLTTTPARLLLVVPLYAYLAVLSELYFVFIEHHPSGSAIYLHKFLQIPQIYIGVALYVWAGMLLSETRIARTALDVLTPWRLPVWLLTWIVVAGAAIPTAYSGASGIFVLAAGAVIFERLRAAGADHRMALAATAMCGSLGVVLRPCLVVVLIALLNKQVTTSELYGWGNYVYLLTAGLFLIAVILRRPEPLRLASPSDALPGMLDALRRLAPYVAIAIAVLLFYRLPLGVVVGENTAAVIIPVIMLMEVIYDRKTDPEGKTELWVPLRRATAEGATQVGALLLFMATSVAFGGVIERTEIIDQAPQHFGSIWTTMAFLVLAKVIVGLMTDVLGGVVLVSMTLAPIAYRNGIHPVHFWMMVMCAFELAYLVPPVALNQLLARQVIGKESHVEDMPIQGNFFDRHEHILLPIAVMGTALLIVAFGPLFFYGDT